MKTPPTRIIPKINVIAIQSIMCCCVAIYPRPRTLYSIKVNEEMAISKQSVFLYTQPG